MQKFSNLLNGNSIFKNKFCRIILLVSLAIVTILPLFVIFYVHPNFTNLLIESTKGDALRVARHFASRYVSEKEELTKASFKKYSIKEIELLKENFKLTKLKVYSKSGEAIFSTDIEDIGNLHKSKYFNKIIKNRIVYAELVQRGTESIEGQKVLRDVVETYIPLIQDGRFLGIFEVYYDISVTKEKLDKLLTRSSSIVFTIAFGLLIVIIVTSFKENKSMTKRKEAEGLQDKLRSLSSEYLLTEESERRHIATELHEHIALILSVTKMKIEELRKTSRMKNNVKALDKISEYIDQTIQEARSLAYELSPPVLYELSLEEALEWLVKQTQGKYLIQINFKDDGQPKPIDDSCRVIIFQAARELLFNIVEHAQARSAMVSVRRDAEAIRIDIEDCGVGFEASKLSSHKFSTRGFGLFSVQERLYSVGGNFEIKSEPGTGTCATMVVPLSFSSEKSGDWSAMGVGNRLVDNHKTKRY
jgi:signal transduction histidine kinase